ncbi:MAG TPA: carboxypeptidase-like regulatory domain-containing protein [Pyrinomonadaceae bacterium]|nr:carboxypeptidase-like regulatory domain-containing protein [Pyrinomonadaceae bacterium]
MDHELFKIAGAVAGIGGLALAAVVYIFREVIRKEIFPQLTKEQAYKLLNRIIVLVFLIGVLGIAAYLVVNWKNGSDRIPNHNRDKQTPTPTPAKAELSGTVVDQNEQPLRGVKVSLDDIPGMTPVETSSDGVFILKDIPRSYGDGVRIRVIALGYIPTPYTEDVIIGKTPPIIKLRRK